MHNRRSVLAVLAAGALAAPVAGCAQSDSSDPAAPWRAPGAGEVDPRRHALAHAILAPNPHNRQPWLVELVGQDEIVFYPDLERLLPSTDPFDRQIVLGCGAFLEVLALAAGANGHRADISLWPEGTPGERLDARPVAHIRLVPVPAQADPLAAAITARRTHRGPFENRTPSSATFEALARACNGVELGHVRGGAPLEELRAFVWESFDKEIRTPARYAETVELMRIGRAEIAAHRDGLALTGPAIEVAHALGLLSKQTLADVDNTFVQQGLDSIRALAAAAPAFVWINTEDNSRTTQVAAGRAYARLNLAATQQGLGLHPWSQALQEYPEMASLHARAKTLLNAPGERCVQMLARIGYPRSAQQPAARRGIEAHVLAPGERAAR